MELNKDKLFNELVSIIKNCGAEEVNTYINCTCRDTLSHYRKSTLISNCPELNDPYFYNRYIYFIDENERIIYMEYGKGYHYAKQMLLNFTKDTYHYDTYTTPRESDYPDDDGTIDWDSWWDRWMSHYEEIIDINEPFTVLKTFDATLFKSIIKTKFTQESDIDRVVKDFIYKVDDSNKLTAQTEYDSVDEFFSTPAKNDIKLDTLIICAIDTKQPLIKLQKVEADIRTEFKFIVEITNKDGDDFIFRSIIKSQDQLNQLIQQTVDALRQYSKFNKYADDLEEYL